MAKWGDVDFSGFQQLAGSFKKALDERVVDRFIQDFLFEMAWRANRKIKKRTPVGVGTENPGNLRRNWKVSRITKQGRSFSIDNYNDTHYAIYVEYGHRTGKDLTNWVEGKFMMTVSMQEIEREWPKYLEKRLGELLDNIMNGRPAKKV